MACRQCQGVFNQKLHTGLCCFPFMSFRTGFGWCFTITSVTSFLSFVREFGHDGGLKGIPLTQPSILFMPFFFFCHGGAWKPWNCSSYFFHYRDINCVPVADKCPAAPESCHFKWAGRYAAWASLLNAHSRSLLLKISADAIVTLTRDSSTYTFERVCCHFWVEEWERWWWELYTQKRATGNYLYTPSRDYFWIHWL